MNKEIIIFEKRAYMNFDLNYKGLSVTVTSKVEKLDASNAPDLKSQLQKFLKTLVHLLMLIKDYLKRIF